MTVARLMVRNMSPEEISDQLGLTVGQVEYTIRKIKDEWRRTRTDIYQSMVDQQLATLDAVQREAWVAWEKSRRDKVVRKRRRGTTGEDEVSLMETTREEQAGNPAYLKLISECVDKKLHIVGGYAPKQVDMTITNTAEMIKSMTPEQRQKMREANRALLSASQVIDAEYTTKDGEE